MSVYLIVDITVHDPERWKEYVSLAPRLIDKHRGTYLIRGGHTEVKEGTWHPERLVVLEFPSKEDAVGFLEYPEYQPVAAIRHAAATTNLLLAEGY